MIAKSKARTIARQNAETAAKIIGIQEREIDQLKADVRARDAVILALVEGVYDYVDRGTGEVVLAIGKTGKIGVLTI